MPERYTTIVDRDAVQQHLKDPAWRIFDCRFNLGSPQAGREAWRKAHLPGAVYADLDRNLSSDITSESGRHPLPAPDDFVRTLQQWGLKTSDQVVVYDDVGGAIAARLWWMLTYIGHPATALMNGGYKSWVQENRPLDDVQTECEISDYNARLPAFRNVITTEVLIAGLNSLALFDARAGERFRGEVEPLDPVAGHIPGALNHPFQQNLDSDGQFLPAAELKARFLAELGDSPVENVVHTCGSGVTACHNLLAMEHAGLTGSSLYAGSWSEWIRDPARPVATG